MFIINTLKKRIQNMRLWMGNKENFGEAVMYVRYTVLAK